MLLLILILLLCFIFERVEYYPYYPGLLPYPLVSQPKRNISLDLRCEPLIKKRFIGIFNISTIYPYYRSRCLVG